MYKPTQMNADTGLAAAVAPLPKQAVGLTIGSRPSAGSNVGWVSKGRGNAGSALPKENVIGQSYVRLDRSGKTSASHSSSGVGLAQAATGAKGTTSYAAKFRYTPWAGKGHMWQSSVSKGTRPQIPLAGRTPVPQSTDEARVVGEIWAVPLDLRHMCESIQETPRLAGQQHKSADDEGLGTFDTLDGIIFGGLLPGNAPTMGASHMGKGHKASWTHGGKRGVVYAPK